MVDLSAYPWLKTTPNVWLILRLSREERARSLAPGGEAIRDVLAKHRSLLLRLAAAYGLRVDPARVVEEIESGDTIADRPRFSAALEAWERLPFGAGLVILSTEVARLTRGLQSDQGRVQNAIARAHGLHVTPARWYDLRIPDHATAWELEGFAARLELRAFKWRMQLASEELLRRGRSRTLKPPFGYGREPGVMEFVADPDRFPLVVAWCGEIHTMSVARIAARDGVSRTTVHATLTNPVICGYPARRSGPHHGSRAWKGKFHRLARDQWEWPDQAGSYPAACTRDEWEAIQACLAGRAASRAKTGTSEDGWCRDVVEFVAAPGPVRLGGFLSRALPGGYLTYERPRPDGPALYVARELVHQAAHAALSRACRDPVALALGLAAWREAESARTAAAAGSRGEAARQLARARGALDEAARLLLESEDAEERASLRRVQAEKLARVRALKAQIEREPVPPGVAPGLAPADLGAIAAQFDGVWANSAGEERRGLVNAVIARIPVEVLPGKPGRALERRLLPVEFQPWLAPLLASSASVRQSSD